MHRFGNATRLRGLRVITLRRAGERRVERRDAREAWLTFDHDNAADPLASSFGAIGLFKERRIPPRDGARQPVQDAEIITYVREGSLAYEDSTGRSGILLGGEFQRMTAGSRIRYGEMNTSPTDWAHIFQILLQSPAAALEPGHEQKRFSVAQRRGVLCLVVSPDGRRGSLKIYHDALLFSSILQRGQHITHELLAARSAWLHVVHGELTLGQTTPLVSGDGAGFIDERAVSITATANAEILLLDLGPSARPPGNGAGSA